MKKLLFTALLLASMTTQAGVFDLPYVTQADGTKDINAFDITNLLDFPTLDPIYGLMEAGGDPNATTIIPLNFDLSTGVVFPVEQSPLTIIESLGGYLLTTPTGSGLLPTPFFEPVYFDAMDWHTATDSSLVGDESAAFLFDPHPESLVGVMTETGYGGQAGLVMSDVTPSAVPIPTSLWLFTGGLLGLVGVARRRDAV